MSEEHKFRFDMIYHKNIIWVIAPILMTLVTAISIWRDVQIADRSAGTIVTLAGYCISMIGLNTALYLTYKREDKKTIVMVLCISMGVGIAATYSEWLLLYDIIQYVCGYLIMIQCILLAIFSFNFFKGNSNKGQLLKILIVMTIATICTYIVWLYIYLQLTFWTWNMTHYVCTIGALLLLLLLLCDREVMPKMKFKELRMPRIRVLAASVFVFGCAFLLLPNVNDNMSFHILTFIFYGAMIGISLVLMLRKKIDVLSSVAISVAMLGIGLVMSYILTIDTGDIVKTIQSLALVIIGITMFVLSVLMYGGDSYNVQRLKVLMLIVLAFYVIPIIFDGRAHPTIFYLYKYTAEISITIVILLMFIALGDKSIKYHTAKERMSYNIDIINTAYNNDNDAFLYRNDFKKLIADDNWTESSMNGQTYQTKIIPLNINRSTSNLVLSKYPDTDETTAEIIHSLDGSYTKTTKFSIVETSYSDPETCDRVILFGKDGFFVTLNVISKKEAPVVKLPTKIFYAVIGYDPTK